MKTSLQRSLVFTAVLSAALAFANRSPQPDVVQAAYAPHQACCGAITPEGYRLADVIDSMHVEQLWLAHEHVNWETGEPDRAADYEGPGKATHCSAFAAAVGSG